MFIIYQYLNASSLLSTISDIGIQLWHFTPIVAEAWTFQIGCGVTYSLWFNE